MKQPFDLPWVIGGHTVAAILGVSQHKTPLQVWGELLGQLEPEDVSGKPVIQRGHALERHMLELYGVVTGRDWNTAEPRDLQYTVNGEPPEIPRVHHPDHPWAVSATDAKVVRQYHGRDQLGSLDGKTTSTWIREKWGEPVEAEVIDYDIGDMGYPERLPGMAERRSGKRAFPTATEIPLHENIQQQWYMWVEDLAFASLAVGIVDDRAYRYPIELPSGNHALFGVTDFLWADVERNDGFIESMVRRVKEFVECLKTRTPPADEPNWRDKHTLAKLLGHEESGLEVTLGDYEYGLVTKSHLIRKTIKAQEQELDRINVDLQGALTTAEVGRLPNGNLVTFRTMPEKLIEPRAYTREEKRVLRIPQERHMKPLIVDEGDDDSMVIG